MTLVRCWQPGDLRVDVNSACEAGANANWSTVTIIDSQFSYPNRPTPANNSLRGFKITLQDRICGCGLITFRDEQQGKVTRGLIPRIREFVRVLLRLPRGYEGKDVVKEMEDAEEAPQ